eukprot:scaffold82095_cov91-Cyclotella_meneghiniana.AAC.3
MAIYTVNIFKHQMPRLIQPEGPIHLAQWQSTVNLFKHSRAAPSPSVDSISWRTRGIAAHSSTLRRIVQVRR